jgi:hypothetical protein
MRGNHFAQTFEERLEARREVTAARLDAAARDVPQQRPLSGLDDAEAGDPQAGVDAEDPQSITAVL